MNRASTSTWKLLGLLFFLGAINFADKAVIGVAAAPIISEFHLSSAQWGVIGGSFYWLFSLSSIILTPWSDRVGPKWVLSILATSWSLIQAVTIFVTSFGALLVTRLLLGVGEGPSYATSVHVATKWLPAERRSSGLAVMTLGSAVGPAALAPVLTEMIAWYGWRSAFEMLAAIGVIWILLWWWWNQHHITAHETRETAPVSWWRLLRFLLPWLATPRVAATILAGFAAYWYLALLVAWMPLYYQDVRHLQQTDLAYVLGISLPWLCGGVIQIGVGIMADRIFRSTGTHMLVLGVVLLVGAVLLIAGALMPATPISIALFSACPLAAVFPLVAVILTENSSQERQGAAQGLAVGLYSLAGLIAPAITGIMIQHTGNARGFLFAFLFTSLLLSGAALAVWWTHMHHDRRQAEATPLLLTDYSIH